MKLLMTQLFLYLSILYLAIKYLSISMMVLILLSGCKPKQNDNQSNINEPLEVNTETSDTSDESETNNYKYYNEQHGFGLEIPLEKYDIELYDVIENKEKYDNAIAFEFVFNKTTIDNIVVSGVLFEIIISDNLEVSFDAEILDHSDGKTYYFYIVEGPTESTGFNEMLEAYKPMVIEIKKTFDFTIPNTLRK